MFSGILPLITVWAQVLRMCRSDRIGLSARLLTGICRTMLASVLMRCDSHYKVTHGRT